MSAMVAAVASFGSCSAMADLGDLGNWESSTFLPNVGLTVLLAWVALVVAYVLITRLLVRFPYFRAAPTDDAAVAPRALRSLVQVTALTWAVVVGVGSFVTARSEVNVVDNSIGMAILGGLTGLILALAAAALLWVFRSALRASQ